MTDFVITENGFWDNMDDRLYHQDPCETPSLSSSGAKTLVKDCPKMFWWNNSRLNPNAPEQEYKPHFEIGKAVHHRLLLADHFDSRYHILDADFNARATSAQADRIAAREEAITKGLIVLKHDEAAMVEAIVQAVRHHPVARHAFENMAPERAGFYFDEEFGFWRRVKYDATPNDGAIFCDLKSLASARPADLPRAIAEQGMAQQAHWYTDMWKKLTGEKMQAFLFVAVEKKPPYCVTVFKLDHITLEYGALLNERAMTLFANGLNTGQWPEYEEDVITLSMPQWKMNELDKLDAVNRFQTQAHAPHKIAAE